MIKDNTNILNNLFLYTQSKKLKWIKHNTNNTSILYNSKYQITKKKYLNISFTYYPSVEEYNLKIVFCVNYKNYKNDDINRYFTINNINSNDNRNENLDLLYYSIKYSIL
jgi:hypothetical protein